MAFFEWLEFTRIAIWVGESLWGYPIMISLHAIGLGTVVGILVMLDLRILGSFDGMPYSALLGLMRLAWVGFVVNLLSGLALFAAQASMFVENIPFLIKLPAIFLGLGVAAVMQKQLRNDAERWDQGAPVSLASKSLAAGSIGLWLIAIIAGRLVAYL